MVDVCSNHFIELHILSPVIQNIVFLQPEISVYVDLFLGFIFTFPIYLLMSFSNVPT